MREKLIELIYKYISLRILSENNRIGRKPKVTAEMSINALASFLIENGVVISPCKVGDTVYQTDGVKIYESTIKNVIYVTEGASFDENAIGKSIFLTQEDAEKESEE